MKLKIIACEILFREISQLVATSRNIVDTKFMPKGLHDLETNDMLSRLQKEIDSTEDGYDAILLGYGLCNNGTAGIQARNAPLVIPRAHDCITLFMGSKEAYQDYFSENPGTYYRTTGWCERSFISEEESILKKMGFGTDMQQLVEKYGEENAKYLSEWMGSWTQNYRKMTYIEMGIADFDDYIDTAQSDANTNSWAFEKICGNLRLLRDLIDGNWCEDEFLIVQPGQKIAASNNGDILIAK